MDKTHIWSVVFVSIVLFLAGIFGAPSISLDNPLWTSRYDRPQLQNYYNRDDSLEDPPEFQDQPDSKDYEDVRYYNKRGFSMLARWRPFNVMARQRTSIRDVNRALLLPSKYDLVSAETRALSRPAGQPLRWG